MRLNSQRTYKPRSARINTLNPRGTLVRRRRKHNEGSAHTAFRGAGNTTRAHRQRTTVLQLTHSQLR